MLVALGLGLFTLCGVCFVFGYAVGQHASPPSAVGSLAASTAPAAAGTNAQSKPAPSQNSFQPKAAAEVPATKQSDETQTQTADTVEAAQSAPPQAAQKTVAPSPSEAAPAPTVVHAALPGQSGGVPAAMDGSGVRPALTQALPQAGTQSVNWMVQIAAVSHPEDADVLVSALRKKGYAVSVHRDPLDTLIHVHVGPFATHNDAAAMRQKLLNDGYNAIVQP
jgi:cell division protein FtsN